MEIDQSLIESQLISSVRESIDLRLHDNAKFLCERLVAEKASEVNLYLLAVCYINCNQAYRSYHILKGHRSPENRYLLAQCCIQLGKLSEARDALCKSPDGLVPCGAAGYYLLGRISRLTGRITDAKEQFVKALRLNPLLWSAYEELCTIGGDDHVADVSASAILATARAEAAAVASMVPEAAAVASTDDAQEASGADSDDMMEDADVAYKTGRHSLASPDPRSPDDASVHQDQRLRGIAKNFSSLSSHQTTSEHSDHDPGSPPRNHILMGFQQTTASTTSSFLAITSSHPTRDHGSSSYSLAARNHQVGTQSSSHHHHTNTSNGPSSSSAQYALGRAGPLFSDWQTPSTIEASPSLIHSTRITVPPHQISTTAAAAATAPCHTTTAAPNSQPWQTSQQQWSSSITAGGTVAIDLYDTPAPPTCLTAPPGPPQKLDVAASKDDALLSSLPPQQRRIQQQHMRAGGGGGGDHNASGREGGSSDRGRVVQDAGGKPRKVSNRLFQEQQQQQLASVVRRSTRLAALAGGGTAEGGNGASSNMSNVPPSSVTSTPYCFGAAPMSSHIHCQNLPDPDRPPDNAPAHLMQAYADVKIRSAAEPSGRPPSYKIPRQLLGGARIDNMTTEAGASLQQSAAAGHHWVSTSTQEAALMKVLELMVPLQEGYRHLCMYRCTEALTAFSRLPRKHYMTAWVQCQVARTHFEAVEYRSAAAAFEAARSLDRHRVEGMEQYSTVLWHLKREYELSHLAQELHAIDRLSPQAWCVLGNFCSLQRDHASAIECFQRALQLDPSFTYAMTLEGHEHFAAEDYEKSLSCYRGALRLDPRHYNAMYGLGLISFRQEKYDMAIVHFKSAVLINPGSSVLHCYIAMTLHRQGMYDRALTKLKEAVTLDPKNPLARFELACVLMSLEMPREATEELDQLIQLSPAEPSVHVQMGKAYKKLGDLERAQQQLEVALSLTTSSADISSIKTLIEKLAVTEEDSLEEL
ncbi:hypothetical protein CEUSTIGMA_g3251.t1 [Chlamydomonas eustigma]|uniref:Cdc23 domain-containing protein n=1 Tax=Chlamydomonas eustigma TaxID=1157962 RepID=A0A250WY82_9CHLO|nr:hypothetical protein CEUSTIGMA_g3251.t1 [Chlamydomonas eustigma]|eukprot:GAX75808.1 hypothetical protein CEUSTIGMA_g3251.t1 [Chlamydomonas eustigma]